MTLVELKHKRSPIRIWRAVELGCEVVAYRAGMEMRMTGWKRGEPETSLYRTEGFAEADPGDAHAAEVRALGGTPEQIAAAERERTRK